MEALSSGRLERTAATQDACTARLLFGRLATRFQAAAAAVVEAAVAYWATAPAAFLEAGFAWAAALGSEEATEVVAVAARPEVREEEMEAWIRCS